MLSTNQKGAIAEAEVTAAAIRLGIEVYRPVQEGGRYDLILGVGERLVRTQVKWANREGDVVVVRGRTSRLTPRGYVRTRYSASEIDGIAAWCPDTDDCYFIPIAEIAGRARMSLRLEPARNNQELLVHWAAEIPVWGYSSAGRAFGWQPKVGGSSPPSSTLEGPLP